MSGSFSKYFLLFLVVLVSQIIYTKLDEKYNFTKKVSDKFFVGKKWREAAFKICIILVIGIIGGVAVVLVNSKEVAYVITGIGIGVGVSASSKISEKK